MLNILSAKCDFSKLLTLAALGVAVSSCVTSAADPDIVDMSYSVGLNSDVDDSARMQLDRLREKIDHRTSDQDILSDILQMLEAQVLMEEGRHDEARLKWQEALAAAEDAFAPHAFRGWVTANAATINRPVDATVFARLMLAQAEGHDARAYLKSKSLTEPDRLAEYVSSIIPERLLNIGNVKRVDEDTPAVKLTFSSSRKLDPFMDQPVKYFCEHADPESRGKWKEWLESLPAFVEVFWQARMADCGGNASLARQLYQRTYGQLRKSPSYSNLALYALHQMVRLDKAQGDRKSIADLYLKIANLWQAYPPADPASKAEPEKAVLNRINDVIWAARYRGLLGDYDRGYEFCDQALSEIEKKDQWMKKRNTRSWRQLMELKAEAFHVRSFRLSVEQGKYAQALQDVEQGLKVPRLNQNWTDRFQWYKGLYLYLEGEYEKSASHWESYLSKLKKNSYRSRYYYWLARAYHQQNNEKKRKYYIDLLVKYDPLNFYSVVGLESANLSSEESWRKIVERWEFPKSRTRSDEEFDLRGWRKDKKANRLLRRAELLTISRIPQFSQMAVRQLERYSRKTFSIHKSLDAFVYLTRLQYAVGEYFHMIWLLSELSEERPSIWHDFRRELGIYFPAPNRDIFASVSDEFAQYPEAMLAVTRQESAFRAEAASHAGAIGYMQLIPETAKKVAEEVGLSYDGPIEEVLYNPEQNIRLGGALLKKLSLRYGGFMPAVFAAYNAGEAAVDAWVARRQHADPVIWAELVPFSETNHYVKNVWRNLEVYRAMLSPNEIHTNENR